jgi:hypothetical protein
MKSTFLLRVLALVIVSSQLLFLGCKKDEIGNIIIAPPVTEPPVTEKPPITETCKLTKSILSPNGSPFVTTYEYNTAGLVIKSTMTSAIASSYETYEYDTNNKLIFTVRHPRGIASESYRIKHEYDLQDRWIRSTPLEGAYENDRIAIVIYDSNGNRTKIDFNNLNGTKRTSAFKFEEGNVVEHAFTVPDSPPSILDAHFLFEYYPDKDNKLKAWEDRLAPIFFEAIPSSNNLIKKWTRVGYGTVERTYEFNEHGYPIKEFHQITGTSSVNTQFIYEYECK